MPVLAGRTRQQIRQSIGYNVLGTRFIVSTTTRAGGDAESVIDRVRLFGGNDNYNGGWVYALSGSNDGEIRRALDFVQGTIGTNAPGHHDMTVSEFSNTVPSVMSYEWWANEFHPAWIEELMNQAILESYGRAFDPAEDVSLHTGNNASRFPIPAEFAALDNIYYRESVSSDEVHAFDRLFDETTDADVTQATDQEDFRRGGASLRLTVAAGMAASDLVTDSISSLDLSGATHIELWIKSSVVLAAGDWIVRLDDGVVQGDSTDLEILSVPAIAGTLTWTRVSIALANPQLDTAIVSVGLEMNVDKGAHVVWFDDMPAVDQTTEVWRLVSRNGWSIDKEGGNLVLTSAARADIGYANLKLVGGGAPVLLTADATVTEVSAWWIICRATELAFQGAAPPHGQGDKYQGQSVLWGDRAKKAYKGLNRLRGARSTA